MGVEASSSSLEKIREHFHLRLIMGLNQPILSSTLPYSKCGKKITLFQKKLGRGRVLSRNVKISLRKIRISFKEKILKIIPKKLIIF